MIETIQYRGEVYPALQSQGFAAQWAFPFAKEFCKGVGFDIGCNREGWCFPGALGIDPALPQNVLSNCDAYNLPPNPADYIFSSHCLEHLPDWVAALDYWATRIKKGGTLFLYLPNCEVQRYWQPQNNRKHVHFLSPQILFNYFRDRAEIWNNVFVTSGHDLNCSFYAIAERV